MRVLNFNCEVEMNIVRFQGGLGNQMFQYSLYKKMSNSSKKVSADLSLFRNYFRPYMLNNAFGIDVVEVCKYQTTDRRIEIIIHALNKIFFNHLKLQLLLIKGDYYKESPEIKVDYYLTRKEGYFDVYWQNENYFIDCKDDIISDFKFKIIDINVIKMAQLIQSKANNTSLHWRRGDYVRNTDHDVLSADYFYRALAKLIDLKNIKHVFIFSEEYNWVEEEIKDFDLNLDLIIVSKELIGTHDFNEMYLMTLCENNIISNSSFSWWGAYLNQNHEKKVIAPSKWSNKKDFNLIEKDRVPSEWLRLDP